jgi:hypothetical protein
MSEPETEAPQTTISGVGIGTIALQLVGVYCFVLAMPMVGLLASIIGMSGGGIGRSSQYLFSLIMPAIYIATGILLIRFGARLSVWLFRSSVGGIMSGPITTPAGQYLQAIAFSVAGVLTMIDALPPLASLLYLVLMGAGIGGAMEGYNSIVQHAAQFLVGLALFLQARGLSRLWHKIRAGGVVTAPPQGDAAPVHSDPDKA